MAKNISNNRIPVKWVRDKAKSAYDKKDYCYICEGTEDLELHHTHSITLLLEEWSSNRNYDISTDEGILAVRDEFIEAYRKEIYDDVFTLCNKHHVKLHGVYGKKPAKHTAIKQLTWISKQREKFLNPSNDIKKSPIIGSFFSKFT